MCVWGGRRWPAGDLTNESSQRIILQVSCLDQPELFSCANASNGDKGCWTPQLVRGAGLPAGCLSPHSLGAPASNPNDEGLLCAPPWGPIIRGTHTSSGQFLLYDQTLPFTGRPWIFGLHVKSPSWASLIAQLVKNPPAMQETLVPFLGWEDPLEKG